VTALEREATRRGVRPPGVATLRRYGLTTEEWLELMAAQDWKCPVCHKRTGVQWVTDHEHVPMWKRKPPEERKRYVRGVLCAYCNHRRVNSRMPAAEARRIADYLAAYEARRAA
jgi:DNA-directed RNA polymerase subunit RPC12/RpoP